MGPHGSAGRWRTSWEGSALTRPLLAWLLLAGGAAAAADVQYSLSSRTDVRVRSAYAGDLARGPDGGTAIATTEVELLPSAEVALGFEPSRVSLLYGPSIMFREPQASGPVVVLHRGRLAFTTRWEGGLLSLTEDGSYGETDVNPLRAQEGAAPTAVASAQAVSVVPYARSATLLNVDLTLSPRASLSLSAGYNLGGSLLTDGGVDADGGIVDAPLPFQHGPTAGARARVLLSDLDALSAAVSVTQASFVTQDQQLVAQATVAWDRQLSRAVSASVSAGLAYSRQLVCVTFRGARYCDAAVLQEALWSTLVTTNPANEDERPFQVPGLYVELLPVASAGVSWRGSVGQGSPVSLGATLRVGPYADHITGAVYERLEGRAQLEWSPARTVAFRAALGGGYAVPLYGNDTQGGDQLYAAEAALTWTPEPWVALAGSGRFVVAAAPRNFDYGHVEWIAGVSVLLRAQGTAGW